MREPTMADIAAHVGVSRQLVSIVLRDMPGASSETRRVVREAAATLGYRPHMGARSMRQTKSWHLGVTFAPAHATESDIVEAMYPAAAAEGYSIVLSAQTRTRTTVQAVDEVLGYRCAGIVVIGTELPDVEMSAVVERAKVPVVVVGSGSHNALYDVVRSTGAYGIGLAVAHLIELGHRRIAYAHAESMPSAAVRQQGYLQAVRGAGLEADVVRTPGRDYTEESGAAAGRALLDRDALPTAVVAGNDQQAVGVLQVLSRAGVGVPAEVSITGFDDSRFAQLSSVDLTTARQDPGEMGQAAVEAVLRRIGRPMVAPRVFEVEPTLVVRTSTAAPRQP
jgi:DNA-binding LacI/PurR family transcriptional regulator